MQISPIIQVKELTKHFRVPTSKEPSSVLAKIGRFFKREWETVVAVDRISFSINRGESVAFLGPNGAGKTTTIKLLTGILVPTSGEVNVLGFMPCKQRYQYAYHIGVVMGQKSILLWDIPVIDSLLLYRDIYELKNSFFKERLEQFSSILGIDKILRIPVRKLSLGERMRAEIAASLLHKPDIVFLDEPTIGLDIIAKQKMIEFIKMIKKNEGVTIFLTTHNIRDVEELCERVILIDKGRIIYDGSIERLADLERYKTIEFECQTQLFQNQLAFITNGFSYEQLDENKYAITVRKEDASELIGKLTGSLPLNYITVHPSSLEVILRDIYEGKIQIS